MKNTSTSAKSVQPKIELLPPSIVMRVGRRRLTLSWRARPQLPSLLSSLLRRSWRRVLAPVLKVSVAAAAVCGAWQTQALAAAPAPGTLPTGWSVVNGNVTFTQNGNTLNINQLSPQAIANFLSFSIGSGAAVDISQPSSAAAFLAKVTGGDISQIYGRLTAPGTVVLFNPNGIAIGAGGVVDVGRFVATTLNINNDDFLAGKLTFAQDRATVGAVENYGNITSATGGSVYLIGSSVTNGGIIKSAQGEVILAAGQSVTLVDTATPGVSVNVTGTAGNVTNLGTITADAGRIGIAAGLITNSGNISASSVVREGGRIFLRASNNLTTTATSSITADGTAGGNITLYADNKAYIDGDVSATGAPGKGGFVETSGLGSLDVVKVPTVGSGGTWLIDPYDLEVVSVDELGLGTVGGLVNAITSTLDGSKVLNTTITGLLNQGTNVSLQTGVTGGAQAGNITVSADIVKTAGSSATLTLNADQDILISQANISSTSGALGLNLNTNYRGLGGAGTSVVDNGQILLNGGVLTASDGALTVGGSPNVSAIGKGTLTFTNGSTLDLGASGTLNAGTLTIGGGSTGTLSGTSSIHADNVSILACSSLGMSDTSSLQGGNLTVGTGGKLTMNDTSSLSVNNLTVAGPEYETYLKAGNVSVQGAALFNVAQTVNNDGEITLSNVGNATVGSFWNGNGDGGYGSLSLINTNFTVNTGFENKYSTINTGGATRIVLNGDLNNRGDINFGRADAGDGSTTISGSGALINYGSIVVGGFMSEGPSSTDFAHTLTMTNSGGLQQVGEGAGLYLYNTLASANINHLNNGVDSSVSVDGGTLTVSNSTVIDGYLDVWSGNVTLGGTTTGNGTINVQGYLNEGGGVEAFVVTQPSYSTVVTLGETLSNLSVNISGGNLILGGATRVKGMSVTGGLVSGLAGSRLNVSDNFSQTNGNMMLADAALNQASGDLVVGNITANNLVLEAENGNIIQYNSTSCGTVTATSLHVTKQLIASAAGDINLSGADTYNEIAAFAANSRQVGNITLLNHLNTTDTSVVTLNGVSATNGNVIIENYGAMRTAALGSNGDFLGNLPTSTPRTSAEMLGMLGINGTGKVSTANGTVSLATHSPLTIGSGGVSASGGISLTAGTPGDPTSALVINGLLSTAGALTTVGNSMTVNANIVAGSWTPPTNPAPVYAANIQLNIGGVVTTPNPVNTSSNAVNSATQQTAQQQQNQQTQNLQNTVNSATVSSETSNNGVSQQASNSNQTAGGTAGNFGDESDGKQQGGKKPLPMCT